MMPKHHLRQSPWNLLGSAVSLSFRFVLLLSIIGFVSVAPASATVKIENLMSAEHSVGGNGVAVYRYGTGTNHTADFSTGTHDSTVNNSGVLELGGGSSTGWWDQAWTRRQCFTVSSTSSATAYTLRFEVDTSGTASNGDDIRVVEGTNGSLLTSYSEGTFPDSASIVWAQVTPLPAGTSTYCVYFENAAATSVSDELAAFDAPGTTSYYTMTNRYNGGWVDVISYVDANTVSDGTTTVVLNTGQTHRFLSVNDDTEITATGPIEASADINGTETLVPEGWADNEFVHPVTRGTNGAWIRSPNGATTIEAVVNGVVVNSVSIGPASGSVFLQGDFASDDTLILRSTNGIDFLALWAATNGNDVGPAVPWFGDTLYGVRSRWIFVGAIGSATVQMEGSDGTSFTDTVTDTDTSSVVDGSDFYGNGTAFSFSSDGAPISAYQYADGNGSEITAALPERLLAQTWMVPVSSDYITVACPTNPTTITLGGVTYNCASANAAAPGLFYGGLTIRPAGTTITADHPIYVYYQVQAANDEHNLLGPKGALPYVSDVTSTSAAVEVLAGYCGTWTSPVSPTSGVFGQFFHQSNTPTGTSATFQISTDGSSFYGPDGTAASSFANDDLIPYVADFASTVQLRIELCTNDPADTPTITQASFDCELDELIPNVSGVAPTQVPSPSTGTKEPLLRVYQNLGGVWDANVQHFSTANLGATEVTMVTDMSPTQVSISGGVVSSPSPTFPHSTPQPYSVIAKHATTAGQTGGLTIDLVDEGQVLNSVGIHLDFIG